MRNGLILCGLCLAVVTTANASATRFRGYSFESTVISDIGHRYPEVRKNGTPWLQVGEGEEYSVVISNPLPVRVAVAVTIDGLNVIDGKRTSPDRARKWMIDANSSITLRGWQTDRSSLRRFVFTNKDESYAQWKGERDSKPYTRNLGVIGVAYFWNSGELSAALRPPRPFDDEYSGLSCDKRAQAPAAAPESCAPASKASRSRAGTGMGRTETNNVVDVEFHYDTGMYRAADVLAIYYEFAQHTPRPLPFLDDQDRKSFAPQMPD